MSVVSEIREGLDNVADAVLTLASVGAQIAAASHSRDYSDQRDMASVFYADALSRFGDVIRKMTPQQKANLEQFITEMCLRRGQ